MEGIAGRLCKEQEAELFTQWIRRRDSRSNLDASPQVEEVPPSTPSTSEVEGTRTATPSPAPSFQSAASAPCTDRPRSRSPRDRGNSTRSATARSTVPASNKGRANKQGDIGDRLMTLLQEPQTPYVPETELDECHHFAFVLSLFYTE
ncbi:hypothetical protein WMY93_009184 [Mugilogobius chulae]|uniref:Uncharacterized protein n=1 Tax=Mugilogobius chulae TaxID=88201 RepID=A0AAW0PLX3_9GOBI